MDQRRELTEEALAKEFSIKFTRAELLTIFNILIVRDYKLGDARAAITVIDKIHDPVSTLVDSDFKKVPLVPEVNLGN